jgi:uncharacterized tellurite resistance protein B-like protein
MLSKLTKLLSSIIPPPEAERPPEYSLQLATAVLLIEVMRTDGDTNEEEQNVVYRILKERFHLSDAEVAQLATLGLQTSKTAYDYYQFTSLINRELAMPEKIGIIEYMWQVAYADGHISAHENHLMHKLADLLYVSPREYIAAKMRAKPAEAE